MGGAKLIIVTHKKSLVINFSHKYRVGYHHNIYYIKNFVDNLITINPSIETNCDTKNHLEKRDPNLLTLLDNRNIINFIEGETKEGCSEDKDTN